MNRAIIASQILVLAQELDDLGLSDEASELDEVASSFADDEMQDRLDGFIDRATSMPDPSPHRVVTQNGLNDSALLPGDRDVEVEQMASNDDVELPRAYELWEQAGKDMGVFEVLLRDEGNHFSWA